HIRRERGPGRRVLSCAPSPVTPQPLPSCAGLPLPPASDSVQDKEARVVFRISILLVALLVAAAGLAPGPFNAWIQQQLAGIITSAGWLYLLIVFAALVFLLYLAVGRFANLR